MKAVWVLVFGIALSSCVSSTPEMKAVQIVGSPQAIAGCKYVKSVQGDQNLIGGPVGYEDALNQMRKKAVEANANRLYIVNISNNQAGANAIADAYRC